MTISSDHGLDNTIAPGDTSVYADQCGPGAAQP